MVIKMRFLLPLMALLLATTAQEDLCRGKSSYRECNIYIDAASPFQSVLDTIREANDSTTFEIEYSSASIPSIATEFFQLFDTVEVIRLTANGIEQFGELRLPNLKELHLPYNAIKVLPDMSGVPNLEVLGLDGNQIGDFGDKLSSLKKLKKLHMSDNKLTEFPDLTTLDSLEDLNLSDNPDIRKLGKFNSNLKRFQMNSTGITELPQFDLPNLEMLNIGDNKISEIPEGTLDRLQNLKVLYLQNCKVSNLPKDLNKLNKLELLNLDNNLLRQVEPNTFKNLKNLKEISMQNTFLPQLPDDLHNMHLDTINFKRNQLKEVREKLMPSINPMRIDFSENQMTKLSNDFFTPRLTFVKLSNNYLQRLRSIADAPELAELELETNQLRSLQKEQFKNLPKLRVLKLANNFISYIHANAFSKLPSLEKLELQKNRLINIHCGLFRNLPNLSALDMSENKLSTLHQKCFEGNAKLASLFLQNNNLINFDVQYLVFTRQLSLKLLNINDNGWHCGKLKESIQKLAPPWIDFIRRQHRNVEKSVYGINCKNFTYTEGLDLIHESKIYTTYY